MSDIAIKIENLRKQYKLGAIGGQTLNAELQSWWARVRGKEDPNMKIGQSAENFGESFWALDGINLEIKKGEAVGIIGGNGAGKSTLLKILSRVTAPTEGDIWIDGRISSMLEVGTGFHGELTGRENIYMNGAILGMTRKEVDEKIESIIDFSECRQFIDTPVKRYSSGMYVKLAFAVASHLDAEIMVMDEVLAVGDMKFQKKCLGKMGDEAARGKTVLYVSHNMATIRSLCDRCIVLNKGTLIYDGDVETAISIYSRESEFQNTVTEYDFSGLQRRESHLGTVDKILGANIINKESADFSDKETMTIEINWENKRLSDEMSIRFVIQNADTSIVGMTETSIIPDAMTLGEHDSIITFPLKNLAPGNYQIIVSLNCVHEGGKYDMRDEAPVPIRFSVHEEEYYESRHSSWLTRAWGNVRFDELGEAKR